MISKLKKICVVTGSRAEYGLLYWLLKEIQATPEFDLQIAATGMHLSPEFGSTYQEIEKDGFTINEKIEMLLSSDTPSAISKSTGLGMIGFADAFNKLNPDLLIVLGDRYEILSASTAAMFAKIPIAHIHGGETTQGAFDEAIRHSITKMSWWHFVAADEYKKRVIQLGEDPKRVFNVGGMGVDAIKKTKLLSKKKLMNKTGIKFKNKNLLITYHPATLEKETSQNNFQSLLNVLADLTDVYFIFTMPNADSDSKIIKEMINEFVRNNLNTSISFTSMGNLNYLSTLQYVDGVLGNSSSGLAEAPTFKIGTINIGDRQKGRLKAKSVIDCKPIKASIKQAIVILYSEDFQKMLKTVKNPYGEGDSTEKIMKILLKEVLPEDTKKVFYDL
jgi:GDP/UDP-N,N'-diacetylbacillosamine 2-epimerase (hydrolysing)